jgi:DNA-binding beta-propeller fold protein YncE
MNDDFITRLGLQLREAAERDVRHGAAARTFAGWRQLTPALVAVAALVAIAAVAATAALWLRGDDPPMPTQPRVVATLHLTPNPAAIVPAFGSLWIADDVSETVLRVDPRTRDVVARFRVPSASHIAITPVGDQLWTSTEGRALIVRIDPATNAVIARTPLRTPAGRRFIPSGLLAQGGNVWAVTNAGALRLDPETGAGTRMAQAPPESRWFTLGLDALWAFGTDGRAYRMDARTGARQGSIPVGLPGAETLGAQGRRLFAAARVGTELARLDPASGALIWSRRLGGSLDAITGAGDVTWVHVAGAGRADRLVGLDTATGRTVAAATVDTLGATGLAVSGEEIWLSTAGGRTLVLRQPTR